MFTVYILQDTQGKIYKGMTADLSKRLIGHKTGNTRSTRNMKGIEVIYQETFETSEEARKREKYFKSAAGRRFLKTSLHLPSSRP